MYRLFLALRYLRSRLVNLISIAGVAASVAVLISVVSIMDGFQERVRTVVRGNLSHIIMYPDREGLQPFERLETQLKHEEPRVVAASPQVNLPVAYPFESKRMSAFRLKNRNLHQMKAIGVDWEKERRVSEIRANLIAGNRDAPFFNEKAKRREIKTVIVGRQFVKDYLQREDFQNLVDEETRISIQFALVDEDPDTQEARFHAQSRNLMITGVYDSHDAMVDDHVLYFDINDLREMSNLEVPYLEVRIKLDDYEAARDVQASLSTRYPAYGVFTWEDMRKKFLEQVNQEKVLLVIVLSFIVLLAGFIILATLTLTVVEKTRDIGIVGALGATKGGVLSIFLLNGLLIGVMGAGLGLALGAWFTANVNGVRSFLERVFNIRLFPADVYHFREIPAIWDWPSVLSIVAGSVLISFLAGLLPALRAARMDPVKALRYE